MSLCHFQVHPEGKFVVDVDKNIDINDVSVKVFVILIVVVSECTSGVSYQNKSLAEQLFAFYL